MKGIVKKNQIIITALAILIAVAGYLNYSEKNIRNMTGKEKEASETISDSAASNNASEQLKEFEEDTLLEGTDDIVSNDGEDNNEEVAGEVTNDTDTASENDGGDDTIKETDIDEVPGTAVLTNVGTFSANARLKREQLRAKNKETLMNMINSSNLSEEQKNDITNEMIHITRTAELENEIETLLEAKGFSGTVVSITDDNVDVVVNMTDVGDEGRAKIEDVVKRKTNIPASSIVITPISVEN